MSFPSFVLLEFFVLFEPSWAILIKSIRFVSFKHYHPIFSPSFHSDQHWSSLNCSMSSKLLPTILGVHCNFQLFFPFFWLMGFYFPPHFRLHLLRSVSSFSSFSSGSIFCSACCVFFFDAIWSLFQFVFFFNLFYNRDALLFLFLFWNNNWNFPFFLPQVIGSLFYHGLDFPNLLRGRFSVSFHLFRNNSITTIRYFIQYDNLRFFSSNFGNKLRFSL